MDEMRLKHSAQDTFSKNAYSEFSQELSVTTSRNLSGMDSELLSVNLCLLNSGKYVENSVVKLPSVWKSHNCYHSVQVQGCCFSMVVFKMATHFPSMFCFGKLGEIYPFVSKIFSQFYS